MAQHNDFGKLGEDIATEYLVKQGYFIIARNWTFEKAEIDIIASKSNTIVFVEVKTRATDDFGLPQEFITKGKILQITKAANAYIEQENIETPVRFDAIGVVKNSQVCDIQHIEEAFYFF